PIAGMLLGITDITVPWDTLFLSVVLYVLIPLVAGAITRKKLDKGDDHSRLNQFLATMKPWSIVGLLATVVLLFGFQSETILDKPQAIVLIAIPLLIQTYG
ncbi:MAG TPA: arsenical-resistance protein, partial [Alteromonas sp.]|nr:arsenical-resistance protein [Alteromonas sp.]